MTATAMAAEAAALLSLSRRVINGEIAVPLGREATCAAALARSALEKIIPPLCARAGLDVGTDTSPSVQVACLRAVDHEAAGEAALLWSRLSRACHEHAYELPPSLDEVAALRERCESLAGVAKRMP